MNFTREPIIETIISPKEGYKLLVRSSKGESSEEYYVDAVEVVSFGRAFFFRSLERPKSFLVPVGDYEVLEVKETRIALKNVSYEKNIKIGGGREAPMRPAHREPKETPEPEPASAEESALDTAVESRMERKRDRRHRRKRRGYEEREAEHKPSADAETEKPSHSEEKAPPSFSRLIPPPSTLISDTLSRYHEKESQEKERKEEKREEEGPSADATTLHRIAIQEASLQDTTAFQSPYFTYNENSNDTFF